VIPVVPFFSTAPSVEFWDTNWNKDAVRANYIIGVLERLRWDMASNR
jgi:hypothetical protein